MSKKRHVVESEDEADNGVAGPSTKTQEPEQKKLKMDPGESVEEMAQDIQDIAAQQLSDIKSAPAASGSDIHSTHPVSESKPPSALSSRPTIASKPTVKTDKPNGKGKGKAKVDPDEEPEDIRDVEDQGVKSGGDGDDAEEDDIEDEKDKKEMNDAAMKLAATYAGTLSDTMKGTVSWKAGQP